MGVCINECLMLSYDLITFCEFAEHSAWQDFVVLVLITTGCYFFFLEQLHFSAIYALLVASFLWLGAAILTNTLYVRFCCWRYLDDQHSDQV